MIINTDKIEVSPILTLTEFILLRKLLKGPMYTTDPDYKKWIKLEERLDKTFANAFSYYNLDQYYKRLQEERENGNKTKND